MRLQEIEDELPILLFNYATVIRLLERQAKRTKHKVPRKEALDHFLQTRSLVKTARHYGVSPATINNIVLSAFRIARQLTGLKPVLDCDH